MRPLRRKRNLEVTENPITGQDQILEWTQEDDILSDQGSVDSSGLRRKYIRDCGCDGPVGGRCFECGGISCQACHGRCRNCQKPICLAHSHYHTLKDGIEHRFCGRCYNAIRRTEKWTKVRKSVLSFFLEEQPHE